MKRLLFILLILATIVAARPADNSKIPFGTTLSCLACHPPGDNHSLTDFGNLYNAQGNQWNATVAAPDSDGGGVTNGVELLDPAGTWQVGDPDPGNPIYMSNPSITADDHVSIEEITWGIIKILFF